MFVGKFAEYLLYDVLKCYDSETCTELVYHDSQIFARLLHFNKKLIDLFRFRNQASRSHVWTDELLFLLVVENIKDVHKAYDLIDSFTINRDSRMALFTHKVEELIGGC